MFACVLLLTFMCKYIMYNNKLLIGSLRLLNGQMGLLKIHAPHLLHQAKEKFTPGSVFCFVKVEYNIQYIVLSVDLKYVHTFYVQLTQCLKLSGFSDMLFLKLTTFSRGFKT